MNKQEILDLIEKVRNCELEAFEVMEKVKDSELITIKESIYEFSDMVFANMSKADIVESVENMMLKNTEDPLDDGFEEFGVYRLDGNIYYAFTDEKSF